MPGKIRITVRLRVGVSYIWLGLGSGLSGCCVYSRVAKGGGRRAASGLWLEGRLCSMLTVMLGGDLEEGVRVRVWARVKSQG